MPVALTPRGACFVGELALPRLETCGRVAALRGVRLPFHANQGDEQRCRHYFQIVGFDHAETLPLVWRRPPATARSAVLSQRSRIKCAGPKVK